MRKALLCLGLCVALAACGVKRDLVRPSDIETQREQDTPQEETRQPSGQTNPAVFRA